MVTGRSNSGIVVLLALVAATSSPVVVVRADPPCYAYGSCGVCIRAAAEECGWCNGKCLPGNPRGPTGGGGECDGSSWHWHGDHCPSPSDCTQFKTCLACGTEEHCGWCDNQCFNGNSSGPAPTDIIGKLRTNKNLQQVDSLRRMDAARRVIMNDATLGVSSSNNVCNGTTWHWSGLNCPTLPPTLKPKPSACHIYKECDTCTESPLGTCGFCNGVCHEGNHDGPTFADCDHHEWYWKDMCPLAPASSDNGECPQWTDCKACLTESSSCGWCDGQCLKGEAAGPTYGECHHKVWYWEQEYCPTKAPKHAHCGQWPSCFSCTLDSGDLCGWCDGNCYFGNASQPIGHTCKNSIWHWNGINCPPATQCSQYQGCESCLVDVGGCGWCTSSGTCMKGNAQGPTGGGKTCGSPGGGGWYYGGAYCPVTPAPTTLPPTPHCAMLQDCNTCVTSPSGLCGFCSSDKRCSQGTVAGPNVGNCSGYWQWFGNACPHMQQP